MSDDNNGDDEDVGYGKPPKHSRWKPGQSGNPRGPKKGSRGLKKDLHKALEAKHSIKVGGKVMRGTTQEMALYTLAARAAAGDIRATKQLVELTLQIFGADDRGGQRISLPKQDQELLNRLLDDVGPEDPESSEESPPKDPHDPEIGPSNGDSSNRDDDGEINDEA
jgi:hypothetical protein